MRNLPLLPLVLMLCAGCSTAPVNAPVAASPKAPVIAEPTDRVLDTAECSELGNIDLDSFAKGKFEGNPYGWTHARIDVEHGAVVKVEIVNSSPKKLFDEQAIAMMKSWRFPSGASASGCFVSHRWD